MTKGCWNTVFMRGKHLMLIEWHTPIELTMDFIYYN